MQVNSLNSIEVNGQIFNSLSKAFQAAGEDSPELEVLILTYEGELRQKAVLGASALEEKAAALRTEKQQKIAALEAQLATEKASLEP